MKKQLLTAVILLSFLPFVKAQRGVGINTTAPSTTLDVTATLTDNTLADAIQAPRMTLAQLVAKDNTSGTYGTNQNGALIYITDDTVGSGSRRAKITGHGFYYFDNTVPEWKPIVSSSTSSVPAFRTVIPTATTTILASDVGNVVVINNGVAGTIILPTANISMLGKKLTIIETTGIAQTITQGNNPTYKTYAFGLLQGFGSEFITDGTNWYALGGQ